MTYAFRKYLNKRGSALFMVLSLMTALMILVMAMYFTVVASRDVQYKVFYQEQAYRSATSLSDAIVAGLKGDSWKTAPGSDAFLSAITSLDTAGKSITTNGNDFKAFVSTGTKEEQDQLGAYTVTITRMEDETVDGVNTRVFDVAITTSSGGVLDTTHTYIHVQEPSGEASKGRTNIFTATGYVPNDVYLHGVETWTDLFYDNEYVMISGENHIYGNLYAGGSIVLEKASAVPGDKGKVATWAIRNNFTTDSDKLKLGTSKDNRGLLMVGGDLTMGGINPKLENADIYVLGDVYVTEKETNFDSSCRVFVGGNIYMETGSSGNLHADIYCNGIVKKQNASYNGGNVKGTWFGNKNLPAGAMTSSEMAKKLDEATASNNYSKWKIDGVTYDKKTITFDDNHATVYLDWQGKTLSNYFGKGQSLKYTAVSIEDIVMNSWNGSFGNKTPAIVIDTGDDPKNQYFIKANANRDYDNVPGNETFEWAPDTSNLSAMSVIVKGKGSVIIDVPDGVTYQASTNTWVLHETWYALLGGEILPKGGSRDTLLYTQKGGSALSAAPDKVLQYTHTDCNEKCTKCNYVVKKENTSKCSKCNGWYTEVSCSAHEMEYSFCPKCEASYEPKKNGDKYYGLCNNRVERSEVEKAVNGLSGWKSQLKASGDGSNWYYPTTNIFVVSCDESADIRLTSNASGTRFKNQSLFGFVYAPYMTYKGEGGNGAGWVIFCGGMIVSDYNISEFDVYLACYPEQLPENLMNEKSRNDMIIGQAPKTWKINLAGY